MKPKRNWRPARRKKNTSVDLPVGSVEVEFGIPIAGKILPQEMWTHCALKKLPEARPVDWNEVFSRPAPLVVDIGCGNGRYTIASAIARPEMNHLALDALPMVIRYGTRRANQRGLQHCKFAVVDGWRFLSELCDEESIAEMHIYHPQPYADPKDISRRMLNPEFMGLMFRKLALNARVYLQTDRQPYWDYITRWMPKLFQWAEVPGDWADEPTFRSRREILARKEGLKIHRGIAAKTQNRSASEVSALVATMEQPTFAIEHDC